MKSTRREARAAECVHCAGCGQIANTECMEPWSGWLSLPLESSAAVLSGIVKPVPCPDCNGTGKRFDLESLLQDIAIKRATILDSFIRAYVAENVTDAAQIRDIALIEERCPNGSMQWYFKNRDLDTDEARFKVRELAEALRGVIREADRDTDAFVRARVILSKVEAE